MFVKGNNKSKAFRREKIVEKDISLDMLKMPSQIALMNAMIGFDIMKIIHLRYKLCVKVFSIYPFPNLQLLYL